MHIYTIMIIIAFNSQAINMYMYTGWHTVMAQSPCFLFPPCWFPFASLLLPFTYLETLLGVIGSRPPRSQATRKLTSPFLTPSPFPPHSKFPVPQVNYAPYYDGILIPASHGPEQFKFEADPLWDYILWCGPLRRGWILVWPPAAG